MIELSPTLRRTSAVAAVVLLGACTTARQAAFQREEFEVSSTYSRTFDANEVHTCEAARRALLSQGYVVSVANAELVNARKSFQPENETHVEIEFRVVCTAQRKGGRPTLAFVSALQDRYALKKSANSASVGVGALGSLSLPFSSTDDSLVKVASETITSNAFYDRYFKLMASYLEKEPPEPAPAPPPPPPPPTSPPAAAPSPAASAVVTATPPATVTTPPPAAVTTPSPAASEPR